MTATGTSSGYRVICEHARGGMGVVYLCTKRQGRFERLYAVKRLQPHMRESPTVAERFLEEGRIAGAIRHAHVVSVLDAGVDEEGPFLVMDFVECLAVSAVVRKFSNRGLPAGAAFEIARQTALGLHAAHEVTTPDGTHDGIVHRDATPQNLLLGFDGVLRVTDFGIAKALSNASKTTTGILRGKLGYMSPEQLSFEDVDRRSDLFTLGVVLFELLSGKRLYDHPKQILHDPPPDIGERRPDLPPEATELLFDLLAKRPEQRPDTAGEVADRLATILPSVVLDPREADLGVFMHEHFPAAKQRVQETIRKALQQGHALPSEPAPPRRQGPSWALVGVLSVTGIAALMSLGWQTLASPAAKAPQSMLAKSSDKVAVAPPGSEPSSQSEAVADLGNGATAEDEQPLDPVPRKTRRGRPIRRGRSRSRPRTRPSPQTAQPAKTTGSTPERTSTRRPFRIWSDLPGTKNQ